MKCTCVTHSYTRARGKIFGKGMPRGAYLYNSIILVCRRTAGAAQGDEGYIYIYIKVGCEIVGRESLCKDDKCTRTRLRRYTVIKSDRGLRHSFVYIYYVQGVVGQVIFIRFFTKVQNKGRGLWRRGKENNMHNM